MYELTPRYLLDKNVIRHLINGLRLPERMGAEEQLALAIWVRLRQSGSLLCMSVETSHILQRLPSYREIALVEKTVAVLEAGRYFKRWAHRLREHGFTREDAKVLSLGTFGTDAMGAILGVGTIVTFDRPLINNFRQQEAVLAGRLATMAVNLPPPYTTVVLARVYHPAELWVEIVELNNRP
jgi:hypothetical protein